MEWIKITILICAFLHLRKINATPFGAPLEACQDMLAQHTPFLPQPGDPPIIVIAPQSIQTGSMAEIIIRSIEPAQFRGFFIQLRKIGTNIPGGRFFPQVEVNTLNCFDLPQSAATHSNHGDKNEVVLQWEAPELAESAPILYEIRVTIVQNLQLNWSPFLAAYLVVVPEQTTTEQQNDFDWLYEGCGESKVCHGIPPNCINSRDCDLFGAVTHNTGTFEFELLSIASHQYVAFGLSQTPVMSDTSVVECVRPAATNQIDAFTSWNFAHPQSPTREGIEQNIIRLIEGRYINGRIYCRVERNALSVVLGVTFDLINDRHYLLLAGGSVISPDSVGPHGLNRGATSEQYSLADPTLTTTTTTEEIPGDGHEWIYDGCDDIKICFGVPLGCLDTRDCDLFGGVTYDQGRFEFELLSQNILAAQEAYVAFGVSQSPDMPSTSVIECVQPSPGFSEAHTSWIFPSRDITRAGVNQNIIELLEWRFVDGRIYCRIEREPFSTIHGNIVDLVNQPQYLLLAGGDILFVNSVGPHFENRAYSVDQYWLTGQEITTTTTTTTTTTEAPPVIPPEEDPIYVGCDTTKLCFGIPNNCISLQNCNLLATIYYNEGDFEFELLSMPGQNYVAFGLSQSSNMGNASVIECVQTAPGQITAFTSWNFARDNSRIGVPQNIVQLVTSSFIDGRIYCKMHRDTLSVVNGQVFDLENEKHYLLLAGGTSLFENSVGPHENRGVSGEQFWLTDPRQVQKAPLSALLLTHGSFMIVAWIGLTSIGVVIARYFKTSWKSKTSGTDSWFIWHVCCMFLTWVLTLIAFIIIFVDVGQWNLSVHSVMGCVVLALVSVQAIGGAARPDPKARSRPIFNWIHQSFGYITHLLAILTIFYAIPLAQSRLPGYTTFVLVAFVSYYVLIHIILTSIDICCEMKRKKRVGIEINKNAPYELLKRTLLGIHIVIVTLFVIALVLIFTIF